MALVFGLDIGIASIGWAAIDEEQEIQLLGLGSRIFVSAAAAAPPGSKRRVKSASVGLAFAHSIRR